MQKGSKHAAACGTYAAIQKSINSMADLARMKYGGGDVLISGGAMGQRRETVLDSVIRERERAETELRSLKTRLDEMQFSVETVRNDFDTETMPAKVSAVRRVLLGVDVNLADAVHGFRLGVPQEQFAQIEAVALRFMGAQMARAKYSGTRISFSQRDLATILVATYVVTSSSQEPMLDPDDCNEPTLSALAVDDNPSVEAAVVDRLLKTAAAGEALQQACYRGQETYGGLFSSMFCENDVSVIGGPEDYALHREMARRDQVLADHGQCNVQIAAARTEMGRMLASDDRCGSATFADLRSECIGTKLDIEAVARICGVTVTGSSAQEFCNDVVRAAKAVRVVANGPSAATAETCFDQFDFTDELYARDATLLCFLLSDKYFAPSSGPLDADRLCELISAVCPPKS